MAVPYDVDPKNLSSSGWGAIFAPDIGADVEEALGPLLSLRRSQAGSLFKIFRYRTGITKEEFLGEQKAGLGPADPKRVPYYLLIVGSPEEIPFRFQIELAIQYAVGRIHFDAAEDYAAYAENVVRTESSHGPLLPNQVAFFGVTHQNDTATERVVRDLVEPLAATLTTDRSGWEVKTYLESRATKAQLGRLLGGDETPALLFASAHGLAYPFGDPLQRSKQGAILCHDWPGEGHRVLSDHYFSAEDLKDDALLSGLIAVVPFDFSAGTTATSSFTEESRAKPTHVAPAPFVSKLAQRLLSHPRGGALGLVGVIDSVTAKSLSKPLHGVFSNFSKRLLDGYPLGHAMEYFSFRHAEMAVLYSQLMQDPEPLMPIDEHQFYRTYRASTATRDCLVIGDPAVRLEVHNKSYPEPKSDREYLAEVKSVTTNPASSSPKVKINEPTQPFPSLTIGDLPGATNDRIAAKDDLGAQFYIWALADLIESRDTQPPLTIGIFGSWGMGKSFLLRHLPQVLEERAKNRGENQPEESATRVPKVHAINFNAWEYGASEAIWPALARKVIDQLEKSIPWRPFERFLLKLRRNLKRHLAQSRGWLFLFGMMFLLYLTFLLFLPDEKIYVIIQAVLTLSGIGVLLKFTQEALQNSLGQWIANVFQGPDYGRPLDLISQIRGDLEIVETRLSKSRERVLILIDDLDRCEPGKSVEMLQAINLLLDFESFIVCLGVDARVVTRAVEKHYQGLLGEAGASGYEYLDKIIQIPFRIPEPRKVDVELFISTLMGDPAPPPPVPAASGERGDEKVEAPVPLTQERSSAPNELPIVAPFPVSGLEQKTVPAPSSGNRSFTYDEFAAFRNLSQYLHPNPRHLKRLLNIYRLVRTLARYKSEQDILKNPTATICWIVVSSQWPYTAHLMMREHDRLLKLTDADNDQTLPPGQPLIHLLEVARNQGEPSLRQTLDRDLGILEDLVHSQGANFGWQELWTIRRYTINFNPAIEFEWMAEPKESTQPG